MAQRTGLLPSLPGHIGRPGSRRPPLWALPLALLLLAAGCGRGPYPLDVFPEMHYQPSFRAQEPPRRGPVADAVPVTGREVAVDFAQSVNLRNPLARTPANLEAGRALYQVNCAMCHGPQGKGNGPLVAHFQQYNQPPPVDFSQPRTRGRREGEIWGIVTNGFPLPGIPQPGGPGGMPAFKNILTEQERWLLTIFVQSVQ
ncbi:MAG: c-type cytochrome [Chloroflexi bacterium]|nr:c-type cytochrome [Chloroflexota bacterium]